jgi:hypothetical protein
MKNHHLLVFVLAALLPVAGMAAGETVPCPDKKAGQWYRFAKTDLYNSTTELLTKIDSVEGDRVIQNGGTYIADKMDNWHKLGERVATPKWYVRIECPFSLGETRVYKDVDYDGVQRGTKTRGTFTVTVAPELVSLTVKAGSFKVVRIVSDNSASGSDDRAPGGVWSGSMRSVSYYAPEIGISVKAEFASTSPVRFRDVYELLEYSLGD